MTLVLPRFIRRLIALFTWRARDRDMDQEMAFHVESLTRDYVRSGMSRGRGASAPPAGVSAACCGSRNRATTSGALRLVEDVMRDVRHTGRGLRRSPGFALAVVLTLALGIGGNTAIFSVVDQLLLRPLPYPNGDRLVTVDESIASASDASARVSPANWLDWQRESRTFRDSPPGGRHLYADRRRRADA